MTKKNDDGLTAYDILKMEGCPYKLGAAKCMTSAMIDFEHIQDKVMEWYEERKVIMARAERLKRMSIS